VGAPPGARQKSQGGGREDEESTMSSHHHQQQQHHHRKRGGGYGLRVDDWLARFYDPANYPCTRCAMFCGGRFLGIAPCFANAMREAFDGGGMSGGGGTTTGHGDGGDGRDGGGTTTGHGDGSDGRGGGGTTTGHGDGGGGTTGHGRGVRFSLALLAPPCMAARQDAKRREQTHIVRMSSDAIFVDGDRAGTGNAWRHTLVALATQSATMARECVVPSSSLSHSSTALKMEVALSAMLNLEAFAETSPELRALIIQTAARATAAAAAAAASTRHTMSLSLGIVQIIARRLGYDAASNEMTVRRRRMSSTRTVDGRVLATLQSWYPYALEGDVHVAARHAAQSLKSRKK